MKLSCCERRFKNSKEMLLFKNNVLYRRNEGTSSLYKLAYFYLKNISIKFV